MIQIFIVMNYKDSQKSLSAYFSVYLPSLILDSDWTYLALAVFSFLFLFVC